MSQRKNNISEHFLAQESSILANLNKQKSRFKATSQLSSLPSWQGIEAKLPHHQVFFAEDLPELFPQIVQIIDQNRSLFNNLTMSENGHIFYNALQNFEQSPSLLNLANVHHQLNLVIAKSLDRFSFHEHCQILRLKKQIVTIVEKLLDKQKKTIHFENIDAQVDRLPLMNHLQKHWPTIYGFFEAHSLEKLECQMLDCLNDQENIEIRISPIKSQDLQAALKEELSFPTYIENAAEKDALKRLEIAIANNTTQMCLVHLASYEQPDLSPENRKIFQDTILELINELNSTLSKPQRGNLTTILEPPPPLVANINRFFHGKKDGFEISLIKQTGRYTYILTFLITPQGGLLKSKCYLKTILSPLK